VLLESCITSGPVAADREFPIQQTFCGLPVRDREFPVPKTLPWRLFPVLFFHVFFRRHHQSPLSATAKSKASFNALWSPAFRPPYHYRQPFVEKSATASVQCSIILVFLPSLARFTELDRRWRIAIFAEHFSSARHLLGPA